MVTALNALFTYLFPAKAKQEPKGLDEIVSNISSQIQELETRAKFDEDLVKQKTEQQETLEKEKAKLAEDIKQADRIAAKFKDLIS